MIRVAAGLVFRQGQLLIAQRRKDQHLGGYWEFPGGKLEPGESPEACLKRELMEELGIEVTVKEQLTEVLHAYPEKVVRIGFYRCTWTAHEPRPLECAAIAWTRLEGLMSFTFPPADAKILEQIRQTPHLWEVPEVPLT